MQWITEVFHPRCSKVHCLDNKKSGTLYVGLPLAFNEGMYLTWDYFGKQNQIAG